MELLECINNILPYFGQASITSVNHKHPTVAMILANIESARKYLLNQGWWFNTFITKLNPDTQKHIVIDSGVIAIQGLGSDNVQLRGRDLFNVDTGSFLFQKSVNVVLLQDIPFEKLPYSAQYWIQCRAAFNAYVRDYGIEEVVQEMQLRQQQARIRLTAQHLAKRRYKTTRTPNYAKYMQALRG